MKWKSPRYHASHTHGNHNEIWVVFGSLSSAKQSSYISHCRYLMFACFTCRGVDDIWKFHVSKVCCECGVRTCECIAECEGRRRTRNDKKNHRTQFSNIQKPHVSLRSVCTARWWVREFLWQFFLSLLIFLVRFFKCRLVELASLTCEREVFPLIFPDFLSGGMYKTRNAVSQRAVWESRDRETRDFFWWMSKTTENFNPSFQSIHFCWLVQYSYHHHDDSFHTEQRICEVDCNFSIFSTFHFPSGNLLGEFLSCIILPHNNHRKKRIFLDNWSYSNGKILITRNCKHGNKMQKRFTSFLTQQGSGNLTIYMSSFGLIRHSQRTGERHSHPSS